MRIGYGKTRIACYTGFFVQAIINNFLPVLFVVLQERYSLRYEKIGRIILINFCTQIAADIVTPFLASRLGYHRTAPICQGIATVGLILMAVLPEALPNPYIGLVIPVVIYAFGSGMMEVILSPIIDLLPSKNKSGSMALLHSFFCWGQAITVAGTSLLIYLLGYDKWRFVPLIWAIIPAVNALLFLRVPIIEQNASVRQATARDLFCNQKFLCFMIFMFCAGASEVSMSQWASMFVQQGLRVNKVISDLLGPCAFALSMGIGRVLFACFSRRYSVWWALVLNNLLCGGCYLIIGLCNQPLLLLTSCVLCGFAVSLSWPGTYSAASASFPNGGTLMFGILALCGDLGCSVGPWIIGLIADYLGLKFGFVISAVYPLLLVFAALFLLENRPAIKKQ